MSAAPDFIIIGAMKAATSTLHEQLAAQPGIFMSRPKEPNFFSDDAQFALGSNWYAALFASAPPGSLCGESSTHYTKLPTHPLTVSRLQNHFSSPPRFIYIMRDPFERLVSHYIHEWTQRVISLPLNDALDAHPQLIHYSRYAYQLQPYIQAFGPASILPVFFESLALRPQHELVRVCRFINYSASPAWRRDLAEQNVSSQRLRKSSIRDAIVHFPGVTSLRRALVPRAFRDWIKSFWTMNARPELTPANRHRLAAIFDDDLDQLSQLLGCSINTRNFADLARRIEPSFTSPSLQPVA